MTVGMQGGMKLKHSCPKHGEKSNKYIKKNCAPSWYYLQDNTGMHGQRNIKGRNVLQCFK
jgi:hypothetical protein